MLCMFCVYNIHYSILYHCSMIIHIEFGLGYMLNLCNYTEKSVRILRLLSHYFSYVQLRLYSCYAY